MKTNPLKEGLLTNHSAGLGTVTRKQVRDRAVELAIINGRSPLNVSKSDWEQAKRELTGASPADPMEAALEAVHETGRWGPRFDSSGHKVSVAPSEDEDEEGRSDGERLMAEGVAGAEHDQMLQAAAKKDL